MAKFPSKQGTGGVRLPSNTDMALMTRTEDLLNDIEQTLAMSIGSVFFNQKASITSFSQLKGKAAEPSLLLGKLDKICESIDNIFNKDNKNFKDTYTLITDSAEALRTLASIDFSQLTQQNTSENIINNTNNNVDIIDYSDVLGSIDDNIDTITSELAKVVGALDTVKNNNKIELLIGGNISNDNIDALTKLSEIKVSKDSIINGNVFEKFVKSLETFSKNSKLIQGLDDDLKEIATFVENLDKLFKDQTALASSAEIAAKANERTSDAMESMNDVAIQANSNADTASSATVSMKDVASFVMACGFTMMLGAALMMIPGMAIAALKFGATLGLFILSVLSPITMLGQFADPALFDNLKHLNSFIFICGFTMLLGAAVMLIPGIVKNSLKFGLTLSLFITSILIPVGLLSVFGNAKVLEQVSKLKSFIFLCTVTMFLGAAVMLIPNIVKNSLKFGATLSLFILMTIAPVMLYGRLVKSAMHNVKDINRLIVTCSIIMLLGAAFMMLGNGKMVKAALKFGLTLGVFITSVMFPLLVFSLLGKHALDAVKKFLALVTVCTIIMMVGALFTMNTKLMAHALAFGLMLASFITLIMMPILVFSFLSPILMRSLKRVTAFIMVCTIVMLIGAFFMQNEGYWKNALLFGGLISAFIFGILLPFKLYGKMLRSTYKDVAALALLVTAAAGALIGGAWFIEKYGADSILEFAVILGLFVAAMGGVCVAINALTKTMTKAYLNMLGMSAFITASSFALVAGAWFVEKYGASSVLEYAVVLGGFIVAMGLVMLALNALSGPIKMSVKTAGMMAVTVAAMSLAMVLANKATEMVDINNILEFLAITGIFALAFAILGKPVIREFVFMGAIVAAAMGVAIGLLSISFMLLHKAVNDTPVLENLGTLALIILGITGVFTELILLSPILILGSIAATLMSVGILTLGTAFLVMNLAMRTSPVLEDVGVMLLAIAGMGLVFTELGLLSIPILFGTAAAILMSTGILTLTLAFGLLRLCLGDENSLVDDITNIKNAIIATGELFDVMVSLILKAIFATAAGVAMLPAILMTKQIVSSLSGAVRDFNSTGKMDISAIKTAMTEFFTISDVCPSLVNIVKMTGKLTALWGLTKLIKWVVGNVADSIREFADLRVPTKFNKDGVAIEYKVLGKSDFAEAAENIKATILTLSSAINDVISSNKWLLEKDFEDKLYRIRRLTVTEAVMMSMLCYSLQSYANLQIPTKWDDKGNPIRFRPMEKADFINAAEGIEKIIVTMAGAINTVYEKYKNNLFGIKGYFIVEQVSHIVNTEAEMVSSLSQGLQQYAQLQVADRWNNKGIATHFRQMTPQEFTDAANNIGTIMTTLAGAIYCAWTGNDYKISESVTLKGSGPGKGLSSLHSGSLFGTPLSEILQNMVPMGDIVAGLGSGLASFAELKIPVEWNEKGKPKKFLPLSSEDFNKATTNIGLVVTTMATAVKGAYDTLDSGNGWFSNPGKMMEHMKPFGEIVGNFGKGLESFAKLQIPTKYDAKGRPIDFMPLTGKEFILAFNNIKRVMVTLATAIASSYKAINETEGVKDVAKVINALSPMGTLIKNVADGVQAYANLKVPIYGTGGKIVGYNPLTDDMFSKAGSNIVKVIMAVLFGNETDIKSFNKDTREGLVGAYNLLKQLKVENQVEDILKMFVPVGNLLKSISEGVAAYAKLSIPTAYDDKGKPISFTQLEPKDFEKAGDSIQRVILTTLFGTGNDNTSATGGVIGAYNKLKELHINNEIEEIIKSFVPVGELIKNMSDGINAYANGMVPTKWDKDGKPIDFRPLDETDYTNAGENIKTVITTIASSLIKTYKDNPELFDPEDKQFQVVVESVSKIGNIIKDISDGITTYAKGGIPIWKDGKIIGYEKWSDTYFENAANNIAKLITATSNAVIEVWNRKDFSSLFENGSEFKNAIDAIAGVGNVIKGVADGVQAYANLSIPYAWDKNGKPSKYRKMGSKDIAKAKSNIALLIISTANAILDAWNGKNLEGTGLIGLSSIINGKDNAGFSFSTVNIALNDVVSIIKNAASMLTAIASLKIPKGFDKNGKATGYLTLGKEHIIAAAENIKDILTQLPNAIYEAYKGGNQTYFAGNTLQDISNKLKTLRNMIVDIEKTAKTIIDTSKYLHDMYNYSSKYTGDVSSKGLTIGCFIDLYGVLYEIGKMDVETGKMVSLASKVPVIQLSLINLGMLIKAIGQFSKNLSDNNIFSQAVDNVNKFVSLNVIGNNTSMLSNLMSNIDSFIKFADAKFSNDIDLNLEALENTKTLVDDFTKFIDSNNGLAKSVSTIIDSINYIDSIYNPSNDNIESGYITSKLQPIVTDINSSISVFDSLSNIIEGESVPRIIYNTGKSLSVLGDGISKVLVAIAEAKASTQFRNNTNDIIRFINNSVNKLDIERIDKLTDLILAMNQLADRTTNLDELTNAIANNLTDVLTLLAQKMDEAKGTFNTISKIQERRHSLINKSIENIKSLMSKQIEVSVSAVTMDDDIPTAPDTPTGQPGNTSTSIGGGPASGGHTSNGNMNNIKSKHEGKGNSNNSNIGIVAQLTQVNDYLKNISDKITRRN